MMSPDGTGDTVFTVGREERGRVAWLIAHITWVDGITRAIEDTTPLDEAQTRLIRLRNIPATRTLSAEIPVDYAYARLAAAVPTTRSLPPVMAYWRALLPKDSASGHPGLELSASNLPEAEMRKVLTHQPQLVFWRMELGSLTPALDRIMKEYANKPMPKDMGEMDWWTTALAEDREQLFTEDTLADHNTRLLDLAYVMHLRGDAGVEDVMAIRADLAKNGAKSVYAIAMTTKTFLLLFETIRQSSTELSERTGGT
jgi:hypothetical protein